MRRRINISIHPDLYSELVRIQHRYGLKNLCELNVAALQIMVKSIQANERREAEAGEDEEDGDIADMFQCFSCWERTPDGTVPVRHNNRHQE